MEGKNQQMYFTFCFSNSQNFNIYKRLFLDVINLPNTDGPESYRMWADLRNFLLQLVNQQQTLETLCLLAVSVGFSPLLKLSPFL